MPADAGGPVRETILEVAGLRSPVLEAGPAASREAVVFLHGNPGSSEDWRDLIATVGGFARAVALDMPGFGRADKTRSGFDYTVAGYARHFGQALAALGIDRVHLVLHDFGGPWGLAWAASHPEALVSTTLINTGVLVNYRWHYLARIWQTPIGGDLFMASANRPAFGLMVRRGNRGGLPKAFVDRMYADFDRGTRRAVLRLYRASRDVDGLAAGLGAALTPLHRPTLVIWGAHDPYIKVEQAHLQRETFPEAQVVILPDSGHWPFADNPGAVEHALVPFLQRVTAAHIV